MGRSRREGMTVEGPGKGAESLRSPQVDKEERLVAQLPPRSTIGSLADRKDGPRVKSSRVRWVTFVALMLAVAATGLPSSSAVGRVTCRGETATIVGTSGNDVLVGTRGVDVISGLGGDDQITSLQGADLICAGRGNDVVKS